MTTRSGLRFFLAIFASASAAACAVDTPTPSHGDAVPTVETKVGTRDVTFGVHTQKHLRVSSTGSMKLSFDGGSYIASHELGHATTSLLDEYVESGFDDVGRGLDVTRNRPYLGELALSGVVRSTKDLLAWRRETAAGTGVPKTITLRIVDANGRDAIEVTYERALPKITGVSQAYADRFGITYEREVWKYIGDGVSPGVALQVTSSMRGPLTVAGSGGRACSVSIIGPEMKQNFGQIIGPERVGVLGLDSRIRIATDPTTTQWLAAQLPGGQTPQHPVALTLQVPIFGQQNQQTTLLNCFLTAYSLTPLDGGADEEDCTESVEISPPYSSDYLG